MSNPTKDLSSKVVARVVGTLFIVALVLAPIASSFYNPVIKNSDWLLLVVSKANQVKIGSLLLFFAALASVSISIWLYPLLKKFRPGLALAAVVFRAIEAVFYIISAVGLLTLVGLGQDFAKVGGNTSSIYQAIGNSILVARDASGFVFAVIAFVFGGLSYYTIFYQTKLIPRWLSVWGLLACLTLLTAVMMAVFSGPPYAISGQMMILAAPIALQELVLGIWLIIKGFNIQVKE
jgi:hypothetical protein